MITLECEQLSEAWFTARAGIPTASCFDKILKADGEPSKSAPDYLCQLAGEVRLGKKETGFSNKATDHGTEAESDAVRFYEFINRVKVERVGFCYRDEQRKYGCSPDGLVGNDGLIEVKCPEKIHVHVRYLLDGKFPAIFHRQVQGNIFVTGREWCDFMSYYEGLPPFIIRVYPDKQFHKKLEKELDKFCYVLAAIIKELKEK